MATRAASTWDRPNPFPPDVPLYGTADPASVARHGCGGALRTRQRPARGTRCRMAAPHLGGRERTGDPHDLLRTGDLCRDPARRRPADRLRRPADRRGEQHAAGRRRSGGGLLDRRAVLGAGADSRSRRGTRAPRLCRPGVGDAVVRPLRRQRRLAPRAGEVRIPLPAHGAGPLLRHDRRPAHRPHQQPLASGVAPPRAADRPPANCHGRTPADPTKKRIGADFLQSPPRTVIGRQRRISCRP